MSKEGEKSVIAWLKTLPEPLRSSALSQCNHKVGKKVIVPSIRSAILHFKSWDATEEGFEFWAAFHLALVWAETSIAYKINEDRIRKRR